MPVYLLPDPSPPGCPERFHGAKERGHPGPGPPRRLFCGVPEGLIDFLGMACPHSSTQHPVSQETSPWDTKPWLLVLGTEGWVKGSTKPVRWSLPPNRGWKHTILAFHGSCVGYLPSVLVVTLALTAGSTTICRSQ